MTGLNGPSISLPSNILLNRKMLIMQNRGVTNSQRGFLGILVLMLTFAADIAQARTTDKDPLPSWSEGPAKQHIIDFVTKVTTRGADYVAPELRVATFDNDGTLWAERPVYFQLLFAIDRVHALAPKHPEWKTQQPFKAVLANDMQTLAASGHKGLLQLIMATHAGMTTAEYHQIVRDWLVKARHPRFKRPFTELVYQPMLELLSYLRDNGFKTFIVSAGGIEFMRVWAEDVYGIPPEQVVGSSIKIKFEKRNNQPALVRLAEIDLVNDKDAKPVSIQKRIGRRPIAAFGNSDGDLQMLQWTSSGDGPRLMLLVHHTDGQREWAYDRQSKVGRLDKALSEAAKQGWTVVDMQKDWQTVFPFQKK